jgi:hypothetical protein
VPHVSVLRPAVPLASVPRPSVPNMSTIVSRPVSTIPRTRVACIYCCDVYSAYRAEFDTCDTCDTCDTADTSDGDTSDTSDDDGECATLLCMRCDVASVVPIVAGSVLYGLSDDDLMAQVYKWHEEFFESGFCDNTNRGITKTSNASKPRTSD